MIDRITHTINTIEQLLREQLPESKYQFELYDLVTNTRHFRGADEPFHWGSVYKLFLVATILEKIDLGELNLTDNLELKGRSKGAGIFHKLTDFNAITFLNACKLIIATSDALISDLLFKEASEAQINNTLTKLEMTNSLVTDNLENIITKIQSNNLNSYTTNYLYSEQFYKDYENTLLQLLTSNFTTVKDLNTGLHNLCYSFYSEDFKHIFLDVVKMPNVWSRFAQYTFFSSEIKLYGKTGTLGFGIVANECAIIIDTKTNSVLGYFSLLTKDNHKTIYQVFDTIGLIGLEIAKLYEEIYELKK